MTDRTWFSRLLRHSARKRSRSILTTPEPARAPYGNNAWNRQKRAGRTR